MHNMTCTCCTCASCSCAHAHVHVHVHVTCAATRLSAHPPLTLAAPRLLFCAHPRSRAPGPAAARSQYSRRA
eukprot:698750-Prymnesium_polylepis.1